MRHRSWRRWFRAFHRDIGYAAVSLVLAYGISGIAVNHIADWNPSLRGHFQETETTLRVFLDEGQEAKIDISTGHGRLKTLSKRAVLFEVNTLHLDNMKGVWTYVADVFAFALMVLALTGMTMMKGDRGLAGRGKYFVLAGLAIPVGFIIYMYS